MEKLPIGPARWVLRDGSRSRGSPVIVSNIETDPLWDVPEHRAGDIEPRIASFLVESNFVVGRKSPGNPLHIQSRGTGRVPEAAGSRPYGRRRMKMETVSD